MKMQVEISFKILLGMVAALLFLWFSSWQLVNWVQSSEGRKVPTRRAGVAASTNLGAKAPKVSLSDALKLTQENPASLDFAKLQGGIATLEEALEGGNNDDQVLLALSDLSFTARDFSRSLQYMQKYSERHPENIEMLAKMGSCLTMLDRTAESVKLLQKVVELAPSDFKAHAFLAIALGKQGNKEESQKYMERAVQLAPNQEAAQRLQSFISSGAGQQGGQKSQMQTANNSAANSNERAGDGEDIKTWLSNHPVVGGKLKSVETTDGKLIISVVQFPMDQMPDSMKISFLAKIWSRVDATVRTVEFVDADTGKSLYVEQKK
jgi:tetratricopeptide (TPR) repeat protein